MTPTYLQQFTRALAVLREKAQVFDQQKANKRFAEQWFAENLFITRSQFAVAYVNETEQLINKLITSDDNERKQYLAEKISEQVLSLSALLQNSRPPDADFDLQFVLFEATVIGLSRQRPDRLSARLGTVDVEVEGP